MQNEKFTNEQITRYISDWQTSGLSKSKFCKLQGLTYHVFLYWVTKYSTPKPPSNFIPIEVSYHEDILLTAKNGLQIRLPFNDTTIHILKQLLAC
jgi:hypothetical protein